MNEDLPRKRFKGEESEFVDIGDEDSNVNLSDEEIDVGEAEFAIVQEEKEKIEEKLDKKQNESSKNILFIEPFYGGSHKQLIDTICSSLLKEKNDFDLFTLPAKKWKWRLRCSAVYFATIIPFHHKYKILFCSSMLNLSELIAVRPDLNKTHKIIYFHENQFEYPTRFDKERDIQFGWNQIVSSISADQVLFNSTFNMNSFLNNIDKFLKVIPDHRPKNLPSLIIPKSRVLYFPLSIQQEVRIKHPEGPLTILWNHRWEYDKNPDMFFRVMFALHEAKLDFRIAVFGKCIESTDRIGESFDEKPPIFDQAKEKLASHIIHWGYAENKEQYFEFMKTKCDVVVSTTDHEFLGISILEAIACGCFALCPNKLVFPEYLAKENLYNTENQLMKKLKSFIVNPEKFRLQNIKLDISKFLWDNLKMEYQKIFM